MKFALLSVTYSGLFYSGKALSLEQQIHKAKQLGFEALAIETKRPIASPLDLSKTDRARLKAVAADEGIALCAIESMSNFCSRHMEERENNLDLRVWSRAVDGIREVAALAADRGITLLLQNHAPVLNPGYEDTLAMMQEIDRKNVKVCIDVPLFSDRQRTDYVREAVEKCGKDLLYTHYGAWNFSESPEGDVIQDPAPTHGGKINYETFIEALHQQGYSGYLVSEYCLPLIRNHKICGIDEVDKATKLGLRYMTRLLERVKSGNKIATPRLSLA